MRDRDGRWWMLRVRPFLTADNRIDGATLVAVDVDLVKRSHDLIEARDYALAIVQTVREPLVVLDPDCRVGLANEAFYRLFGETPAEIEGRRSGRRGRGVWSDAGCAEPDGRAARGRSTIADLEIAADLPSQGRRTLVLNARPIVRCGRPRCCCSRSTM